MPKPVFRYPLSYIAFHTYAFTGEAPVRQSTGACANRCGQRRRGVSADGFPSRPRHSGSWLLHGSSCMPPGAQGAANGVLPHCAGFMRNEFAGTTGWGCPCASQPGGCGGECSLSGDDVLSYYEIMDVSTALRHGITPCGRRRTAR